VVHELVNRSFIKKRIVMITKQKSRNITLLKSLLILPVAAILVVSFSFTREPASLQQVKMLLNNDTENKISAEKPAPPVKLPAQKNVQPNKEVSQQKDTSEGVFFIVEEMPKFQGESFDSFRVWAAEQIRYPKVAADNGIEGRVFVRFIVFPDGHVDSVEVIRGVDPALDAEAVRVVKSSPRWTPGKQRGKKVAVAFTFPITFQLGKKEPSPPVYGPSGDEVFFIVEQMPRFQGGTIDDFREWVAKQLVYPEDAAEEGISGRVLVSFIVETDGSLSNIKVVKGSYPSLDAEALRVVKSSPKWEPGVQRNRKVRVSVTIPINFITDHTIPAMEDIKKTEGQQLVYVVDGKKIKKEEIKNLDAARVARVWVSTEKKVTEKYGPEARDGVIFITTYKEVPEGKTPPKPKPPKKK
jgi:TonB family protein